MASSEKLLKKLIKRARKATNLNRKRFGSISDLIKLRKAVDKYTDTVEKHGQATGDPKLKEKINRVVLRADKTSDLTRKRFGSIGDLVELQKAIKSYLVNRKS